MRISAFGRIGIASVLFSMLLIISSTGSLPAREHAPKLCIGGGGVWQKSVEFEVTNLTDLDWTDKIIEIPIAGTVSSPKANALPLVNQQAQSVRFCDLRDTEYIFNIVSPQGTDLHRGSIPENARLMISVTCPAKKSAAFKIFFDNPQAWVMPDWLKSKGEITNLDFELGTDKDIIGWNLDASDAKSKLNRCEEKPYSGKKCIKCEVAADAEPSWIAARQTNLAIVPGNKYHFEAWVRAQNIKGSCGWFLHIGNSQKPMIASPMIYSGTGSYDWKKVEYSFTAPEKCDLLTIGTVLRGSGTAWYDAVKFTSIGENNVEFALKINPVKKYESVCWYPSANGANGSAEFKPELLLKNRNARYALLRVGCDSPKDLRKTISVDLNTISSRWGRDLEQDDFELRNLSNQPISCRIWSGFAFFSASVRANSDNYFLLIEKTTSAKSKKIRKINAEVSISGQAFPGTSMQTLDTADHSSKSSQPKNSEADSVTESIPDFILKANIVKNGNIEDPDFKIAWSHNQPDKNISFKTVDPRNSFLGKQALEMSVDSKASSEWRGFRQSVKVTPNTRYLCGYTVSSDSPSGGYQLHHHQKTADGKLSTGGMGSLGKTVGGKTGWTRQLGIIKTTADTERLELHLTSTAAGTVRYDDLFLIAMESAEPVGFSGGRDGCFQIPAIIKVFEQTTFEENRQDLGARESAFAVMAKNEKETIQIAIRSKSKKLFQLAVTEPIGRQNGLKLTAPETEAVATVPVDYGTSYYNIRNLKSPMIRKIPTASPSCDGWAGIWPDPLIPVNAATVRSENDIPAPVKIDVDAASAESINDSQFVLALGQKGFFQIEANKTRALQFFFKTEPDTPAGLYDGSIFLKNMQDGKIERIPYTVEVLNFTLPDQPVKGAIYDARITGKFFITNPNQDQKKLVIEYLTNKKLYPDGIPVSPKINYNPQTGKITSDWTEFDQYADWYFNTLNIKLTYTPNMFYLFGWGMPPRKASGENPYPGEYPYEGADRAKLRPEYKKAYQAILREFWTHVKAKGWADRFVLYISDEPFYSKKEIIEQMKALCDMIHEVDPSIPIYSSTWHHVPQWDGYINVWGIGHYGLVSPEQIQKIKDNGGRIWWTTDGQMCLDTPYCAVERLLPYSCVRWGADAYEFWGATWYTYDPFNFGWHIYIPQSDQPGVHYYVRYPNGDGYIVYPGKPLGLKGALSSIRMEQAREGVEDAAWLTLFKTELDKRAGKTDELTRQAQDLWNRAMDLVPIPCPGGRYSSLFLKNPEQIDPLRYELGKTLIKMRSQK